MGISQGNAQLFMSVKGTYLTNVLDAVAATPIFAVSQVIDVDVTTTTALAS
jgi:hypothetical protein